MGIVLPALAVVLLAMPAFAAEKSITLYLDGARVEQAVSAVKGYAEIPLPATALPDSLRIKPPAGITIDRVDTVTATADPKQGQQLEKLTERRDQLEDRLQALATRERIFTAAAKSQSGKAPRKTKNNPEPLAAIRQGTDFAIAQLEGVYQAKRKAEKELKSVQARLDSTKKAANIGGSKVKIRLKGRAGKIIVSYLVADLRWQPVYDFKIDGGGSAQVVERAVIPALGDGVAVAVVFGHLADAAGLQPLALKTKELPEISTKTFPLADLILVASPQPVLSFSMTNDSAMPLDPGEAFCYHRGEYLGRFSFAGLTQGKSGAITCGK